MRRQGGRQWGGVGGEGLARAGSVEGEAGRVDSKEGAGRGRWQWEEGDLEGNNEKRESWRGEMGRGQREGGDGNGARGGGISQTDMMECLAGHW